jgi:hypothetical protein
LKLPKKKENRLPKYLGGKQANSRKNSQSNKESLLREKLNMFIQNKYNLSNSKQRQSQERE